MIQIKYACARGRMLKTCILKESLEKVRLESNIDPLTVERCSEALSYTKGFLFGNTDNQLEMNSALSFVYGRDRPLNRTQIRPLNRTIETIASIREIYSGFFIIISNKMLVFIIHPSRLFRERYIGIDSHNDNDAGNERYFLNQNGNQNVLKSYQEYLIGFYVLLKYDAEVVRRDLGNFDSACIFFRDKIIENNTKDLSTHEITGEFATLIHSGVNQTRELRESALMFCPNQNN